MHGNTNWSMKQQKMAIVEDQCTTRPITLGVPGKSNLVQCIFLSDLEQDTNSHQNIQINWNSYESNKKFVEELPIWTLRIVIKT